MPDLTDTPGIHHVTGIAGAAADNAAFYAGTLGLRFLTRTVNFEDMLAYHLYYGAPDGRPGSVLTFFPYGEAADPGRVGKPQPAATALAVPEGSLDYWADRLRDRGVAVEGPTDRFDERALRFADPDGTRLELVTTGSSVPPETEGPVPEAHGIRGISGVSLLSVNPYATAGALETLGFERVGQEGDRVRYRATGEARRAVGTDGANGETTAPARIVDVLDRSADFGREGPGTYHHLAVRAPDVEELYAWHDLFREREYDVSRVKDRHFFHSLYVREPGGILIEIATDPTPGEGVARGPRGDEGLYLPPRFAEDRDLIEDQLPPIDLPAEVHRP
ncbi:ring-cleaving dioxygenase [Haloparvum alkalitolerans]|uniref:VOC family protein n=1 Tax=Haloparvum alkalitolerans TaxID=1042953 RepID=UPI003CF34891